MPGAIVTYQRPLFDSSRKSTIFFDTLTDCHVIGVSTTVHALCLAISIIFERKKCWCIRRAHMCCKLRWVANRSIYIVR
jgi:hypothetical protein